MGISYPGYHDAIDTLQYIFIKAIAHNEEATKYTFSIDIIFRAL